MARPCWRGVWVKAEAAGAHKDAEVPAALDVAWLEH
jgi:hypothetical protein